jgi:tRNA (guanine37-N1)-methyltransferase
VRIDVITIFPDLVELFASSSLLGRARDKGLLDIRIHDLRSVATDPHRSVDDSPFGGGAGMVLKPGPIFETVERVQPPRPLLYLSPAGPTLDQNRAIELASLDGFSLLCGRYEGIDERVREHLIDGELSIGDYVLAGGEVAAAVVLEAVGRLVPGMLGNAESAEDDSFSTGLLEYPHYTRPSDYRGWTVPEVLRSGDHGRVARWRRAQALVRTARNRPDLLDRRGGLSADDRTVLAEFDLACVVGSDDAVDAMALGEGSQGG